MSDKLLDGLARALAEPMPRGGALRLLASSLAALAVPGLVSRDGRAGVRPERRSGGAAAGRQTCPDGSVCPENVCCPHPSPLSGAFNCCKTTAHCCCGNACCDPQGQICLCPEPGGIGGRCIDKTCGPNITEPLGLALLWMKREFAGWSALERRGVCDSLYDLGPIAWDIAELDPANRTRFIAQYGPECTTCGDAVQVGFECHHAGSVNYVVFGAMMRLCHDDRTVGKFWFSEEAMNVMIVAHKTEIELPGRRGAEEAGNLDPSIAWAKAGYHGWQNNGRVPRGDRAKCHATCGKPYAGHGLTVRWSYKRIRFPG